MITTEREKASFVKFSMGPALGVMTGGQVEECIYDHELGAPVVHMWIGDGFTVVDIDVAGMDLPGIGKAMMDAALKHCDEAVA